VPDEDARITDFLPGEDDSEQVPGEADDECDVGEEPDESDTVDPAEPTATWRADGACEACGATVERRWRDDGALVCVDCKGW
jgi:hypothetical protein